MKKTTVLLLPLLVPLVLASCERQEPKSAQARLQLPGPDFVADAGRGRTLFEANCAKCHGQDLRGTTQGPPFLDPIYRPGHHADVTFYSAVKYGVMPHHWRFGPMSAVQGLTPEDVGDIVAFVRQEQRAAGIE
jgi:mono/diheme cytochrome c family protein